MFINEAVRRTGLTKKAIAYYCSQGLVCPSVMENGYREFSLEDISVLRKISILRKLDMPIRGIRAVLSDTTGEALKRFAVTLELHVKAEQAKQEVLRKVSASMRLEDIQADLETLENSMAVSQRILLAFPSYFGRVFCLYFARFLKEPAVTHTQKAAYTKIIDFLDNAAIEFPEDLQDFLCETIADFDSDLIHRQIQDIDRLMDAPEAFLRDHRQSIEQQLKYRQSDEYRQSPAFLLQEKLKELMNASGYYEVLIPAMKELSPSYAAYANRLADVNQIFLAMYPEAEQIDA